MQLTRERRKRRPGSGYKEAGPTPEAHEAAMWLEQGRGRKWLWTGATLCSSWTDLSFDRLKMVPADRAGAALSGHSPKARINSGKVKTHMDNPGSAVKILEGTLREKPERETGVINQAGEVWAEGCRCPVAHAGPAGSTRGAQPASTPAPSQFILALRKWEDLD